MVNEVQEFCLRWNNHHSTLISVLDSLLERETFVDVMLAAEGQFVKVHRLVLCACSQYFEDLLSQQTDKQAIVFLKDVRFIDLKALVDYMYRGEVNVSQDQLAAFLQTAEALKIKGLADKDNHNKCLSTPSGNSIARKVKRAAAAGGDPMTARTPPRARTPTASNRRQESPEVAEGSSSRPSASVADVSQSSEVESEDQFIAIDPKIESMDADLAEDNLESTSDMLWPSKENEEEWSNSEALSVSSPADHSVMYNQTSEQESWTADNVAGPSGTKSIDAAATTRGYTCTRCGRQYAKILYLTRHETRECGKDPAYRCHLCSYNSIRKFNLKLHLKRVHNYSV